MKKFLIVSIVIAFFLVSGNSIAQNIAISDVSHTADVSAVLDVYSTSLGMLVPRLSSAPTAPATGLLYFDTGSSSFKYFTGSTWTELSYGNIWTTNGTDSYLTNLNDNLLIGTNLNVPGHKFYVHQAGPALPMTNSRIDGQVEFWNYTGGGNLMLADINDNGGPMANGIMQLYFGGNAGIRLLANGNSYFNGGSLAVSDVSHSADVSAVLDVQSATKGMLMPRMAIAPLTPATGLIYYNTSLNSFMYNAGTPAIPNWTGLSGGGGLWSNNGTDTYLTNPNDNLLVGISSNSPGYRLYIYDSGPGVSTHSRIDGQLEIWDFTGTGNSMLADINDYGGSNGVLSLYNGISRNIQLLASGNSFINGGNVGIGASPATLLHLTDNNDLFAPQLLIDNPTALGAGNTSLGFSYMDISGTAFDFSEGIFGSDGTFKVCNTPALTNSVQGDNTTMLRAYPSGIVDLNNQSRARVYQNPNPTIEPFNPNYGQIIPFATWTMVNFDVLSYDQQNEWNLAANAAAGPSYFKVTEDGYYQVNSRIDFVLDNFEEQDPELIPIHNPNYPGYVSIAIYVSIDNGQTWNMYAQGNKLQGADNGVWEGYNDLRNNLAPNVSDVIAAEDLPQKGSFCIAIFAWQNLWTNGIPLRTIEQNGQGGPPTQVYCSIHKSS